MVAKFLEKYLLFPGTENFPVEEKSKTFFRMSRVF